MSSSPAARRATPGPRAPGTGRLILAITALGVVFGDIGTSPLYTIQTLFNPDDPHPVEAPADAVFGLVSLIVWSVTIIVTLRRPPRWPCVPTSSTTTSCTAAR